MSIFNSNAEKAFFYWLYDYAAQYADEGVSMARCFELAGEQLNLPEELVEWAYQTAFTLEALEAGIPLSVIEGKTKLSDHFSPDYIKAQRGAL